MWSHLPSPHSQTERSDTCTYMRSDIHTCGHTAMHKWKHHTSSIRVRAFWGVTVEVKLHRKRSPVFDIDNICRVGQNRIYTPYIW